MDYARGELEGMGFAGLGVNVKVHRTALFFGCERIHIGNNVRIDCYCVLSAGPDGVFLGDHVHLAAAALVFGSGGVVRLEDLSGLSSRATLYTATDDYSEGFLTNPTVPDEYRKVTCGPVVLRRHALVGCGAVLLPNVEVGLGGAVGALSLVTRNVPEFTVVFGSPARKVNERGRRLLDLERRFLESRDGAARSPAES
jgi:acetyltransferase-like isoleucine patch superfamily enzyme